MELEGYRWFYFSTLGLLGLVLAIFTPLFIFWSIFLFIPSFILCLWGLIEIKRSKTKVYKGRKFAIIGLLTSIIVPILSMGLVILIILTSVGAI